ncbi:pirin family protein [Novosphingobium mangrovi (ex Huang et al. 2023)]|uniref:Pirin family protein n=1 Tax=Novosphingobium mangrovi (ex Huang et al. 2023) TaxID=2976432 RepID=A0ABT2I1R6_9SPHN|nr:pirin family protein [Novosphingobium mangrovi (ex Huang et al. 2023)]MCT2398740.1 pirin family protein [Novosphingobium mangrovi (ex Huang et al. 2023)]
MIERIIDKRPHDLGGGFEVGRVLPFHARRMVGPYIFFDHMGPVDLAAGIPRELDVRPHPHIGLSTVTYLYDGALTHRDSLGFHQEIRPGEVNWMVAGSGITHSERFEYARAHGAHMHGIQAWVALPVEDEETDPAFYHHEGADLPTWNEQGIRGRLIAGEAEGMRAAVKVHSPQFYMHWDMEAGASRILPAEYEERAIYVAAGTAELAGQRVHAGQMAVFEPGRDVPVHAEERSTLMALGGAPIGPRFLFWNFVSSSRDRIEQAKEDWRRQRMKLPDDDDREFAPLPAEGKA